MIIAVPSSSTPTLPPSCHPHLQDNNSAAPGFCQKPAGELSACYFLLFLWGFSVPLVVVISSRQKFWQRIMLNSTRDVFRLPPWRSGLWVGNGPWHSYTLCFSAGPHNSRCDLWCVPGELVFRGGGGHVKCKTWKGGALCKTNQASLKGLAF